MKKILKILVSLIFVAASSQAFAEMNIALSFTGESGKFVCDDVTETVNKQLYGITALLVNDSDVAFRWYLAGGTAQSDIDGNGFMIDLAFGVGKAFVRSEKILSALTGCVGFDMSQIGGESVLNTDGTNKTIAKSEATTPAFKIGLDFTTIFKCNKRFGFYTNLGLYYSIGGRIYSSRMEINDKTVDGSKKEGTTSFYGFSLAPSIGVDLKLWD